VTYEDTTARDGTTSQVTTIWAEELIEDEEMEKVNYFSLFPKLVYSSFLGREITDVEKEYTHIVGKSAILNSGNHTSSNMDVLEHPAFADIKNFILRHIKNYKETILVPKYDMDIVLTESWLNFTNINQKHHMHKHNNSYLSGVFYLNTVENDSINFHNEESGLYNFFDVETEKHNEFNSPNWELPVKTGQLILFQSSLQHGVNEVKENKTRISLAFNTFIKGQISSKKTVGLKI